MTNTNGKQSDALVSVELPGDHLDFLRLLADAKATSPAEELRQILDYHVAHTLAGPLGDQIRAAELNKKLGPTLVAALTGTGDLSLPGQWAMGEVEPSGEQALRLELGYRVWNLIKDNEGEDTARAWFIGGNHLLGERTPLTAIRSYEKDAILKAAQSFLDGVSDV